MASQEVKPMTIKIGRDRAIGPKEKCFIIAEIGQNHQGDINLAKQMISLARDCGADCVKFQKSHLPSKFNKKALLRPYNGPNSWGETYGDHKKYLEFSDSDFIELKEHTEKSDLVFSSSVMDEASLEFLNSLDVPFIKIGSGDAHNRKLLERAAQLNKPLIVSTGMSNADEVIELYNSLKTYHNNFCLLHCTSSYPLPLKDVHLNVIKSYKNLFPDINIGYSGHELGIDVAVAAVALGAKVIEKHFTLDKSFKGSDHICSLTPPEFKKMVLLIRKYENNEIPFNALMDKDDVKLALGGQEKKFQNSEIPCYEKLGKTLVAAVDLQPGTVLTWENICLKVAEPRGVPGNCMASVIGKTINRVIREDDSILPEDLTLC